MAKNLTIVCCVCAAVLAAAADEPAPLTVDRAIAEAEGANPELRAAQATIAAARGVLETSKAFPNPEVHFANGIDRHIGMEQTFEWPGKRALRRALAERNVAAAEIALDGLRQTIGASIRKLFFEALAAQQTLAAHQQAVAFAEQLLAAAARRVSAGVAGSFEKTKAELEVVRMKMDLRKAQGETETAYAALAVSLGRRPPENGWEDGRMGGWEKSAPPTHPPAHTPKLPHPR